MQHVQEPLPEPPADATTIVFTLSELHGVRTMVEEHAQRAGLSSGQRLALVLAVDELASNSIKHAGGGGELRIQRVNLTPAGVRTVFISASTCCAGLPPIVRACR